MHGVRPRSHRSRIVTSTYATVQDLRPGGRFRFGTITFGERRSGCRGPWHRRRGTTNRPAPSSARAVTSAFDSRASGRDLSVARPRSRSTPQMPATNPSSVNVLSDSWVRSSPRTISGAITRDRSAYESSMFSKSYRKRGGAGVSGSGRGRVGQVEQLPPALVAERDEARPQALEDLAELGQAAPRLGVHHAHRPESRNVAGEHGVDARQVRRRFAEPGLDRGMRDRPAPAPQSARRHLDEWHAGPHRLLEPEADPGPATASAGGRRAP